MDSYDELDRARLHLSACNGFLAQAIYAAHAAGKPNPDVIGMARKMAEAAWEAFVQIYQTIPNRPFYPQQ